MSTLDSFLNHPIEALEKALHIRKQIIQLEETLKGLFGSTPVSLAAVQSPVAKRKGKRTMSPAARAKIAAAQKRRWAKSKGESAATPAVSVAPVKPAKVPKAKKGGMSAEGRARIVAAQKARWAKVKSGKPAPAPAKAAGKKKRKLSPEARARIVAAVKARWAKAKKAAK